MGKRIQMIRTIGKKRRGGAGEYDVRSAPVKDWFDMTLPGEIRFFPDHFVLGDTYRSVWAVRGYPPGTDGTALLSALGEKKNVTVTVRTRRVDHRETGKIIQNAARRNRMNMGSDDVRESVTAGSGKARPGARNPWPPGPCPAKKSP